MHLKQLLKRHNIWLGSGHDDCHSTAIHTIASGHPALDAALCHAGWPLGSLIEILVDYNGIGEMQLVLPTLAELTRNDHWVVLIAPPYIPYAPALAAAGIDLARFLVLPTLCGDDVLWAMNQMLRAGAVVLSWLPSADYHRLRRLQLAAETGVTLGFLFRSTAAAVQASPAAIRLRLIPGAQRTTVQVIKQRGSGARPTLKMMRGDVMA